MRVKSWLSKEHGLSKQQIAAKPLADLAFEFGYGPTRSGGEQEACLPVEPP